MTSLRAVLCSLFVASALFGLAVGPEDTDGKASRISTADLSKLRAEKRLRCLVPTWVPPGYKVYRLELDWHEDPTLMYYAVIYKNGKGGEFTVQMASDGLGDAIFSDDIDNGKRPVKTIWAKSPIFGKTRLESIHAPRASEVHSNWAPLGKKALPAYVMLIGYNVEPPVAKRIIEGLRFLKR